MSINIVLQQDLAATWHYLIWMYQHEAISCHVTSSWLQVFLCLHSAAMSVLWYKRHCAQAGLFSQEEFPGVELMEHLS